MSINQKQILAIQQKLSPQQIQQIKLLEIPLAELEQRIKEEVENNIVLEEDTRSSEESNEGSKTISVEEYLNDHDAPSYKSRINNYSKDDKPRTTLISGGSTLQEYLIEQLGYHHLTDRELSYATYIIGSIDEDGYLRRELDSISDDIAFALGFEVSTQELEKLLSIIHQLEPTGVGARNLRECLLLQINKKKKGSKYKDIITRIIRDYFDEFAKKHYEKLMSRLRLTDDQFRAILTEIRLLSPRPSNLYSGGGVDMTPYIIPDFILEDNDGVLNLSLNSYNIPEVKVSQRYTDMMRDIVSAEGTVKDKDKDTLQFVKGKLDSAKWFITAIQQRQDTLLRTMREILNYQREYFKDGDRSKLAPMILKDIADRTSLDVSTISRVVNSKYIQTAFGIIFLKSLFSEAMQTNTGDEVSSYEIKDILQGCVNDENKRRPLTDETLMDILNDKGYCIARRTVAKYREMMGIPVARLRKQI